MEQGMTLTFSAALQSLAPVGGPLAGRVAELARLRAAWSHARAGHGGVVLIGGEGGVGKSRLAAELAAEAENQQKGAFVLVGRCPAGGADPYAALVEALGPIVPKPGSLDRDALFDSVADDLVRRSRRLPVLLVLDDLHHADPSTLVAVRHIADVAAHAAILVVGTYRDGVVDRAHGLSDLLDQPEVVRLSIDGLAVDDLGAIHGDAALARRLWRWSAGNPLVVSELLRLRALDEAVPPQFDDLVARRLDVLDAPTRRVLQAAAVVGMEFTVPVVAAVADVSVDRVNTALDRAAAAGFVVTETMAAGTRRFVHGLVRETVERGIDAMDRTQLHRRAGRALERSGAPVPPARVAAHFRAASPVGSSASVLRHASRAAEAAMEVLAWEDAEVHYGNALAASRGAAPGVRADLLLGLGEAQRLAGETARARQAFLEAAGVARRARDGRRMARAALALGQVAAGWGADPVLESLAGEARALLGEADEPVPAPAPRAAATPAPVFTDFASDRLYDVLPPFEVESEAERATAVPIRILRPAVSEPHVAARKDDGAAAALLRARHAALAGPEHVAERLATAGDLVAIAAETGDEALAATGRGWRFVDLLEAGRLEEAAVEQSAHAAMARGLDLPALAVDAAAWAATRALIEGRPTEARASAEKALALGTDTGDPEAEASFLLQRWQLALDWGNAEELVAVADACDGVAREDGSPHTWRAMAALALARAGEAELAAEEVRRATGSGLGLGQLTRDAGRLHPLTCVAETAWLLGDGTRAATVAPLLEPFAHCFVVAGRGRVWRGSAARAAGLAAAAAGDVDRAERHLHAALAAHRRAGALPLVMHTGQEWSLVLRQRGRRGDRRRANDAARSAAELAVRLGMAPPRTHVA